MDKLDQLFKKVVGEQQEPYDPSAWDSLSKRLDAGLPPKSNPFLKWGLPSAAIVIGISLATWYFSDRTSPVSTPHATSPKQAKIETQDQRNSKDADVNVKSQEKNVPLNDSGEEYIPENAKANEVTIHDDIDLVEPEKVTPIAQGEHLTPNKPNAIESKKLENSENHSFIAFPSCAGEFTELKNSNSYEVIIKGDKVNVSIAANSSKKISFGTGTYQVVHSTNNAILQTNTINGPKGEVVLDELVYENGLPVQSVHVKTDATVSSLSYGKHTLDLPGKDVSINPFNKGTYAMELALTDEHGCTEKISTVLNVNDDYNLLAVNAFEPNSQDARKSTFIPFALTQRATPFRMIILDPNDGGLVFETTDANQAWDGIDKRFGRIADANKAYVWKVILSQPRLGEKSEYMGTVVRM